MIPASWAGGSTKQYCEICVEKVRRTVTIEVGSPFKFLGNQSERTASCLV
jgi:hypothetical protein